MHTRIALSSIPTLTFYKDAITLSRRTSPIQQLVCLGKPCSLYTPDVVRCENVGGTGDQVDWKCEADLPDSLRFGRVEVSCEGWSGPGDSYVLKGSCGLQYRLVEIPKGLRQDSSGPGIPDSFLSIIYILCLGVLLYYAYRLIKSYLDTNPNSATRGNNPRPPGTRPGGGGGGGGSSGWFPGDYHHGDDHTTSPPPYSKSHPDSSWSSGWRPGFWTGAALGSLGTSLFNNRGGQFQRSGSNNAPYDWERERERERWGHVSSSSPLRFFSSSRGSDDRGEGPSNLGPMRRSTGLGGSNVR